MKKYWMTIFFFFALLANAQIFEKTAINLGYRYTGRNVLQAGLEFRIGDSGGHSVILGPSLLYTRAKKEDKLLPEANVYYTTSGQLYGVSINQYSIEPRVGVSLLNIFFLNTGYSFPIDKNKYFKGITFGIQLNIAPVRNSKFYDQIKIM